jgi:hypothetical protein
LPAAGEVLGGGPGVKLTRLAQLKDLAALFG